MPDTALPFKRRPDAEEIKDSAAILAKTLLQDIPGLLPEHRRECMRIALWKITEAEAGRTGKHRTRFRSMASLSGEALRHDHVFQQAKMLDALMEAKPEGVDAILRNAVGCTVTKEEHYLLDRYKHLDGWERYKQAGIVVIDMETGKPFGFP
jgi:hypothetical protein